MLTPTGVHRAVIALDVQKRRIPHKLPRAVDRMAVAQRLLLRHKVEFAGLVVPPNSVYAAHALVGGRQHRAVVNIGLRPTLQNPARQLQIEVHLLDFSGDLYDQELEIAFVGKLRGEHMFPSLEALRKQIERDIEAAHALF